jgi:membrane associated rhomboid family serine protease
MIPLKDDLPSRSTPVVTLGLIALNLLAFLYQLSLEHADHGLAAQALVAEFGLVPCRLAGTCQVPGDFPEAAITIFTSMFLHAGLFHVGGNMLYLWIFGWNVEHTFGHARYLAFYLLSGVAAALAQTAIAPDARIPMIGASGAVSGVLGAYLLLFPHATILVLVIFGFFIRFIHVPALIVLGFWIVVQFLNGLGTYGTSVVGEDVVGGVAWFAHIGGFLAGMMLLVALRPRRRARI